ncbi:cytotoxic and regulatory T-cell molecule isoform X2 [Rhinoderma darwinii]|uniref:cytotoxic and regulatory T-cell molecule isoform X2 n=1 Tax=Rhinoderma darwinii TaxID=43563 RepID=UPI003F67DB2B
MTGIHSESHTSRLSVEEGKAVTLRCVFPGGNGSDLQWLTPRGYTSYFNGEKVLKDRRHQLVRYSRNKLIIGLSNITRADDGVYSCLYYSAPVQTKRVRLSVLAAPSPPSIEAIKIPGKGLKEKHLLTCSTSGGRPCPRLTWLIDDHTEVFGHKNVRLESDGRCSVVSTLRVSAASRKSRARCVVRHKTLTPGNLTASYSFHTLSESQITEDTRPHPSEAVTSTSSVEKYTTANVRTPGRKREHETKAPDTTDVNATSRTNEASSTGKVTAAENIERSTTDGADGSATAEVVTFTSFSEENSSLETDVNTTAGSKISTESDVKSFRRESHSTLILVLVSLMLCVLLVIVHLFLLQLRKAHYTWKKENETSDQTLESTKSRSNNEETSSQNRNAAAAAAPASDNHKVPAIQYNTQVSM